MDAARLAAVVADSRVGATLHVRVIPRAQRSQLAGIREGALLVRLSAPPVEGAANDALIELLADALRVPRRSISVAAGDRSRVKRLTVSGLDAAAVRSRLAPLVPDA
jgi:uncharacterized protein